MEIDEFVVRQLMDRLIELNEARKRVTDAKNSYRTAKSNYTGDSWRVRNVRIANGKLNRARQAELAALNGVAGVACLIVNLKEVQDGRDCC